LPPLPLLPSQSLSTCFISGGSKSIFHQCAFFAGSKGYHQQPQETAQPSGIAYALPGYCLFGSGLCPTLHARVRRRSDKAKKSVSVFVDNSFSMAALSKDAPLLELAKQRARDIVKAYGPADRFQVLTTDFEGRDQRLVGKEDALGRIEEIRDRPRHPRPVESPAPAATMLNTGKAENRIAFLISDFQENIADLANFSDTLLEINLVPMRAVRENNISIDSAWFESPVQILNQPANLLVKISNRGEEDAGEVRLALRHDGQSKPVGACRFPRAAAGWIP
jgi:hypothetical protein